MSANSTDVAIVGGCADIAAILARLPHRYPFVLVDRLIEHVPMKSARAIKNVSRNEPFFESVGRDDLRMPQMLIVEAMAQTCALLCSLSFLHETN